MNAVLAIDPGPVLSAFVVWDGHKTIRHGHVSNNDLLSFLAEYADQFSNVCERIASYGMPVGREVFETCFWTGRFIQQANGQMSLLERGKVKMHLCQSMRAKDGNIRQALIDRIGPQGTKKNPGPTYGISGDVWAALALAVTYHDLGCPELFL